MKEQINLFCRSLQGTINRNQGEWHEVEFRCNTIRKQMVKPYLCTASIIVDGKVTFKATASGRTEQSAEGNCLIDLMNAIFSYGVMANIKDMQAAEIMNPFKPSLCQKIKQMFV